MNATQLIDTAHAFVGTGKGLLAMDESSPTCDRRFAALGIAQSVNMRRSWRELIMTTPCLADCISGAILYDETIRQRSRDGTLFVDLLGEADILVGIKVDTGTRPLALHAGETITEGLDGLHERLAEYARLGARFAKWRAVIRLGDGQPSRACIDANAGALARYAALCQDAGLVPVVEPEVLMDGDHGIERCGAVTERVLLSVFDALRAQDVMLEAVVLKPNMALPGLSCAARVTAAEVATATLAALRRSVPAAVAGVAFLSGGQNAEDASARLNAINLATDHVAWPTVFSFARAIQAPALALWRGAAENVVAAQAALIHRARCDHAALSGNYRPAMEPDQRPLAHLLAFECKA